MTDDEAPPPCDHRWLLHQAPYTRTPSVARCMDCGAIDWDLIRRVVDDFFLTTTCEVDAELLACRQALAVQVLRATNAEAAVDQMRAGRFAPGPVVFPSALTPGRWMVRCDACRAGALTCTTEAIATGFAERHVHVYPDDEGFVRGEGWPE